jgi:hypothetical protein
LDFGLKTDHLTKNCENDIIIDACEYIKEAGIIQ